MSLDFLKNPHARVVSESMCSDYAYDEKTASAFARKFRTECMIGAILSLLLAPALVALGYFFQYMAIGISIAVIGFICGCALILKSTYSMSTSTPVSTVSGELMEIYEIMESSAAGKYELAYACKKSKTYFRKCYIEPGGDCQ